MNINIENNDLILQTPYDPKNIEIESSEVDISTSETSLDVSVQVNEMNIESGVEKIVTTEKDHNKLLNRDKENQHPIKAIEGLKEALNDVYTKDEIDKLASELPIPSLDGYATEQWVENKGYITKNVSDLTNYYNKKEVDTKLENLPTGGTELTGGDNTVIEDNAINVYTNTGYKVIDKDIQLQTIKDSGTSGTNKIVYAENKEIMFIIDGTNKIRKSENGIDFEVITLPRVCKDMLYMNEYNRLICLTNDGYLLYSDDFGLTWKEQQSSLVNNANYLFRNITFTKSFSIVNVTNRTITFLNENFSQNSRIVSSISPNFCAKINDTQFIWCNNTGTFKYGAGSQEGIFASLSGVTINFLKRVNNITMVGLKNSNKMYLLEPADMVTKYKWIEYTLPDTCTINDIICNPYDETYYIFTDIKTYYKTKDFVNFEPIDKNGLRGIQGYFTSMGIQMTASNHNELLLAPTRTKLENKAQEWDRAVNKSLWVGNGLELTEEDIVNVKISGDNLGVSKHGINLQYVDEYHLTEDVIEALKVAIAKFADEPIDPYAFDGWFWGFGIPQEGIYGASKIVFNQAGSFYNQFTWEEEYIVEAYEYGYIFCDQNMTVFKYVKLGNLSWLMN